MKQLFLLVVKYIRRQKFRTTLTFLCILFAVFVFNLLCDAFVIARGVGIADLTEYGGEAEADLVTLLDKTDDKEAAVNRLRENPAIEKYFRNGYFGIGGTSRDKEGYQCYLEFSVDGGKAQRTRYFTQTIMEGDPSVYGERDWYEVSLEKQKEGGIVLPAKYQEAGYKEGDTVTVTLRAVRAKIPEDQPALQEALKVRKENRQFSAQQYKEKWGDDAEEEFSVLPEYDFDDSPGREYGAASLAGNSLFDYAVGQDLIDDLKTEDETFGETVTYTGKILAFQKGLPNITIFGDNGNFSLFSVLNGDFADKYSRLSSNGFDAYDEDFRGFYNDHYESFSIVTNQNMGFDEAMEAIYEDLGLSPKDRDEYLHPLGEQERDMLYNTELLMLKFRGQDCIASWFTDTEHLITILVFLIVSFVIWALMRFVIDNAFEISVQERSAQFATLRIMGASRRQIGMVVAFEALFYCIAAVPLGVFLSYLCRSAVFKALADYGYHVKDTSFPVLTFIGIVLALTAILVSAYTSSMWAARAYNPLEASKKTHLKGNQKESVWTKGLFGTKTKPQKQEEKAASLAKPTGDLKRVKVSKLNRKQKSFLRNYTMRNIRRTRSRFVVSVISLSLGTMLFAFGLTLGAALLMELDENTPHQDYDFLVGATFSMEEAEEKSKPLTDSIMNYEKLTDVELRIHYNTYRYDDKKLAEEIKDEYQNPQNAAVNNNFIQMVVNEVVYNQRYRDVTGISYSDFVESGGLIIEENLCGPIYNWNRTSRGLEKPDYHGIEPSYTALTGKKTVCNSGTEANPVWHDMPILGMLRRESANEMPEVVIPIETVMKYADKEERMEPAMNYVYTMKLSSNPDYIEVRDAINKLVASSEGNGIPINFSDIYAETTGVEALIRTILTIAAIALAAVWMTGIFTMLNTVNSSVLNRAEELAMLRMIGMSRKMMRRTVVLESSMYCVFSTVIGGVLGISGSLYVMGSMDKFQSQPERIFAMLGIVLAAVIGANFVISRIAALPGLHTLKKNMEAGRMMQ